MKGVRFFLVALLIAGGCRLDEPIDGSTAQQTPVITPGSTAEDAFDTSTPAVSATEYVDSTTGATATTNVAGSANVNEDSPLGPLGCSAFNEAMASDGIGHNNQVYDPSLDVLLIDTSTLDYEIRGDDPDCVLEGSASLTELERNRTSVQPPDSP